MASVLTQLSAASYEGITMYVSSEGVTARGRKIVIHDFPNSGKRHAQDLGKLPPEFAVEAVVKGENFLQDAKNLINKLDNTIGAGQLVLPHQGALSVVALPYKVDYKLKSIGVIGFSLKFTINNATDVPALATTSVADVRQLSDETKLAIQDKLEEDLETPKDKKGLLTVANDYRRTVVSTVASYTNKVNSLSNDITRIANDIDSDLTTLVRDPIAMARNLIYGLPNVANGLFASFSSLFADSNIGTSSALDLITFGEDFEDNGASATGAQIALWPSDTAAREIRNSNRVLLVESVRMNSLLLGYEVAANYEYETSDEITAAQIILEEAYESVMLSDEENGLITIDSNIKQQMDEVRTAAFEVLQEKLQQVYSVGSFSVRTNLSITNLVYKLYAEDFNDDSELSDQIDEIILLNPDLNPLSYTGDIKIFEKV